MTHVGASRMGMAMLLHCEHQQTVGDGCGHRSNLERTQLYLETPESNKNPSLATHSGKKLVRLALKCFFQNDSALISDLSACKFRISSFLRCLGVQSVDTRVVHDRGSQKRRYQTNQNKQMFQGGKTLREIPRQNHAWLLSWLPEILWQLYFACCFCGCCLEVVNLFVWQPGADQPRQQRK